MIADDHRKLREMLGAYAVGALSADEATRVLAHIDGCAECRELLAELVPIASALTAVDPAQLTSAAPTPPPVEPLLAHLATKVAGRRRRLVATASGIVAVAAAVLLTIVVLPDSEPQTPVPEQRALRSATDGVSGTIGLLDRLWGTQLTLEADGLPARKQFVIWVQQRGGQRVPAGTLVGLGDVPIKAQLGASIRVDDAEAVGVSDDAGRVVLSARVQG